MDWNKIATGWDEKPGVRDYAQAAFGEVERTLAARERTLDGLRVLDFGCGTGLLSELLAPRCQAVVGLDASPGMISGLRQKIEAHGWTHVTAFCGTLDEALESDGAVSQANFDLVVCSSVCAFVPDYPGTLASLVGLLNPKGVFVQFDWDGDNLDGFPAGLTVSEIKQAQAAAGLRDVEVGLSFVVESDGERLQPLMGAGTLPIDAK